MEIFFRRSRQLKAYMQICMCAVFALVLGVQSVDADPPVDEWERSIVRVWNMDAGGRGTGWFVNNDHYIVTNEHVVADGNNFAVQLAGTQPEDALQAQLIWSDARLDLAVLRVPDYQAAPFPMHYEDAIRGSRVYTAGYPGLADDAAETLTNHISIYGGTVSLVVTQPRTNRRIIQHDNIVNAGNSGGPLLDDCGRVLGVTSYGRESEGIQADFVWYSVHIIELKNQLDALGISYDVDNGACSVATTGSASGEDSVAREGVEALGSNVEGLGSDLEALKRFFITYGAVFAAILFITLVLALRKPRERIVQAVESVSRRISGKASSKANKTSGQKIQSQLDGAEDLVISGQTPDGTSIRIELERSKLAKAGKGLSLGRDNQVVDIQLADKQVSRRHARVGLRDEVISIEDLNSTNGTIVNGKKGIPFKPQEIRVGDQIKIGRFELSVSKK